MRISKSKFVAGVQCLKRLYWKVHQPELASEPGASGQAMMDQGQEVGRLAHQLFPGGVKVDGSGGLSEAIRLTKDLVENSEVPAVFEGTFSADDVLVRVDILKRQRDKRWRLIEVKSSTELKDYGDVLLTNISQERFLRNMALVALASRLTHALRNMTKSAESFSPRAKRYEKMTHLSEFNRLWLEYGERFGIDFTVHADRIAFVEPMREVRN
jgi:hypothetical protein